jgi:hypothetical protein
VPDNDRPESEVNVTALISGLFDHREDDGEPPWWQSVIEDLFGEIARLEKDSGEALPIQDDFLRLQFDQRDLVDRAKVKWYDPGKRTSKKKGVCVHHTAVSGGFGAHKSMVKRYSAMSDAGLEEYKKRFQDFRGNASLDTLLRSEEVNAIALACRYRGYPSGKYNTGVPYHAVTGPNSVLYLNLPFDWVTWHGNGANSEYLGYGWDGNSKTDEIDTYDVMADLRQLVQLARDEGHPIESFTCHCAWTNKPSDPGKEFIEQIIEPLSKELDMEIDWRFKDKKSAKSLAEVCGRSS